MSVSILIVDDDDDDIDMFIEAVESIDRSITCLQAKNGILGIALLKDAERKPEYVFVDMNMPKMSGVQFIAEIRKDKAFENIKLILYSTSRPSSNLFEGADYFICKPTTQEELCLEISKVISNKFHVTEKSGYHANSTH